MLRTAWRGCTPRYAALAYTPTQRAKSTLIQTLQERGLVKAITSPSLEKLVEKETISIYCGVDPTAPSLHVGNLLTLLPVLHFHLAGHNIYPLVGGATGHVGDPAGKNAERDKLASEVIDNNVKHLSNQLSIFVKNGVEYARSRDYKVEPGESSIVNNADWYQSLAFLSFMADVGRNVRISSMLARDSVKYRLTGDGMSFGEFTYQLLQAYDFWHLYKTFGVRLQIGGSDQYGNITAGTDLIGRLKDNEEEVFGLTVPLLTTPSGEKFGKSAGNAIWLDSNLTSPFDLYQYFVRTPDFQLDAYLKLFTLLPMERIAAIMAAHEEHPSARKANHILAGELVTLIHGKDVQERVSVATRLLFPDEEGATKVEVSADAILNAFKDDSRLVRMKRSEVIDQKIGYILRHCQMVQSGKEAKQLIDGGGLNYRGNHRVKSAHDLVDDSWLVDSRVLLLRKGKNRFLVIELV